MTGCSPPPTWSSSRQTLPVPCESFWSSTSTAELGGDPRGTNGASTSNRFFRIQAPRVQERRPSSASGCLLRPLSGGWEVQWLSSCEKVYRVGRVGRAAHPLGPFSLTATNLPATQQIQRSWFSPWPLLLPGRGRAGMTDKPT